MLESYGKKKMRWCSDRGIRRAFIAPAISKVKKIA